MILFRVPFALVLFVALILGGCAAKSDLPSRLLFPLPPDEPRLEFIGVYASADDLATSKVDLMRKSFLGGSGSDRFVFPAGVAIDSKDRVYVSDSLDKNVKIVDFNKKTINYMFKMSPLQLPIGLAFDREGRLYIADARLNKVMVFAPDSEALVQTITTAEMKRPSYIAINDRLNRIYVADAVAQRVFVFDKSGALLFKIGDGEGPEGKKVGGLYGPQGLAIAPDDQVYVPEIFSARISVFEADGKFVRTFGKRGDSIWAFDHPKALAFDSEGHLYITDSRRGRIIIYATTGELLMVIGEKASVDVTGFFFPAALVFDSRDRLFVADSLARRLSVWQYLSAGYLQEKPVTPQQLQEIEDYLVRTGQRVPEAATSPAAKP